MKKRVLDCNISARVLKELSTVLEGGGIRYRFDAENGGYPALDNSPEVLLWSLFYWNFEEISEGLFLPKIFSGVSDSLDNYCATLGEENLIKVLAFFKNWIELPSMLGHPCYERKFTPEYKVQYFDNVFVNLENGIFAWETHAGGINSGAAYCSSVKVIARLVTVA
jgi:hypothetical protein